MDRLNGGFSSAYCWACGRCASDNYFDRGRGGVNKSVIFDPNASTADLVVGISVMKEVLTITGETPDLRAGLPSGADREWCINTAAVDPFTKFIIANGEDGKS